MSYVCVRMFMHVYVCECECVCVCVRVCACNHVPKEHLAETAALREFLEEQKVHADAGRGALTGGTKRLWMPWVEAMSTVLSDGKAVQRKGAGSRTFITLTTLGLEPELLAIITCQNVLNLLMLPCFRNKDEMQANARQNRFGEVPFTTAATRVGEALCLAFQGVACRPMPVGEDVGRWFPILPGAGPLYVAAVVDCRILGASDANERGDGGGGCVS